MTFVVFSCTTIFIIGASFAETTPTWQQHHESLTNVDTRLAFNDWKSYFNKSYSTIEDEAYRFFVFIENWLKVIEHNLDPTKTFTMSLNKFGDVTGNEFQARYLQRHEDMQTFKVKLPNTQDMQVPDNVDWTNVNGKSYVTPVQNQGVIGSSSALVATAAIESATAIAHGQTGHDILKLSSQQLVECCKVQQIDFLYAYAINQSGLCAASDYPDIGSGCEADQCPQVYDPMRAYVDVVPDSVSALEQAVAVGPVAVIVEADQPAFQFYTSGILAGTCGTNLDHTMLAVGYGTDDTTGQEFWKLQNSWGTNWGMHGFVLLCKECDKNDGHGECGVLMRSSYPIAVQTGYL